MADVTEQDVINGIKEARAKLILAQKQFERMDAAGLIEDREKQVEDLLNLEADIAKAEAGLGIVKKEEE